MAISTSYSRLRKWYVRLSQREQLLVVVVVGAALYFLMDALVYAPQQTRKQALIDSERALQLEKTVVAANIVAVERTQNENKEQLEREYQRLKRLVPVLEQAAGSVGNELFPLRNMLAELMGDKPGRVSVVGFKTVAVKPLSLQNRQPAAAGNAAVASGAIQKHGLDFELRGRYLDLMAYLQALEERYPKLFWANASLSAEGRVTENLLRLSVFMLSVPPTPKP